MNILFIMCDQLRADYLSCYGHPHIRTDNIDKLASLGVRFSRAYCQAPLCGPSRASFYTGRYMSSHGVMGNGDPLKIGELTLGDYLRQIGMAAVVVGKSEGYPNRKALEIFNIDLHSEEGRCQSNNGFYPFEAYSGLYPDSMLPDALGYVEYLRNNQLNGNNPWERWVNSAINSAGERVSGWQMRNAGLAACVPEEHSETAFITKRAIDFLDSVDDADSWCMHLSYIKPHWPYLAPDPYHNLYNVRHVLPAIRHDGERKDPHPVYNAFMLENYSQNFSKEEVRSKVIPTYMGLIHQVDDYIGEVIGCLERKDWLKDTIIVFTSDHGDYLGDHWLGEKDLFHNASARIPLIIYDPSEEANDSRGKIVEDLVQAIDVCPTLLEAVGADPAIERLEGRSLLPLIRNEGDSLASREAVISEINFSSRGPRLRLRLNPYDCRAYMVQTNEWKFIFYRNFPPQLFDLKNDPNEFFDLGADPRYDKVRQKFHNYLFDWMGSLKTRTEVPFFDTYDSTPALTEEFGIMIGHW